MRLLAFAFFASASIGCGSAAPPPANAPPTETGSPSTPAAGGKHEVFRDGDVAVNAIDGQPDAYEVIAPDEKSGVDAEYAFIATLKCGGGSGLWKTTQQSLLHEGGRSWDALNVVCTVGDESKTFKFDITSFFGKM